MLDDAVLNFLRHLAKGLADQFGPNCEVVIHDLSDNYKENSIVAIENGHVSNRKVGDGPSLAVLDALAKRPAKRRRSRQLPYQDQRRPHLKIDDHLHSQ